MWNSTVQTKRVYIFYLFYFIFLFILFYFFFLIYLFIFFFFVRLKETCWANLIRRKKREHTNEPRNDEATYTPYQIPHFRILLDSISNKTSSSTSELLKCLPRAPNPGLDQSTISFLQTKNVHVTRSLVNNYFRYFHPFFPIIDRNAFSKEFNLDSPLANPNRKILLLRAVLCSASVVVPMQDLKDAGYLTRRDAIKDLYDKTELLYNLKYELDGVTNIQCLLLMSFYFPGLTYERHTWYWVACATNIAQTLSLHSRIVGFSSTTSLKDRNPALLRRIWYACMVRDRQMALGTGRPLLINKNECSVPELTIADVLEDGDLLEETKVKLMFRDLIKLCDCIAAVVSLNREIPTTAVEECEKMLESWYHSFQSEFSGMSYMSDIELVNYSVMHSMYNTTIIALYQMNPWRGDAKLRKPEHVSEIKVREASSSTAVLVGQLMERNVVRFCPGAMVTSTLPSLIVTLLDMRKHKKDILAVHASELFNTCLSFLGSLSDTYWHARFYYEVFSKAAAPLEYVNNTYQHEKIFNCNNKELNNDTENQDNSDMGLVDYRDWVLYSGMFRNIFSST